MITKAARRYASALLQIAKEQDNVESILSDVELIQNTIDHSRELEVFLRSPIIKFDDKAGALDELFGDKVEGITRQFIKLLARKSRIGLLYLITQAFIDQYNQYAGIIEIEVFTARELPEDQQRSLHKALEAKTGKKVNMQLSVNESLKGGIAVRIDDTVIDGTIKHKLEQLEESFLSSAAE
ncbi:ATP synthase F1 subunit delta [Aliifodinibius sp. S!AR15-10]|uniref:ATP synthase F1 subunit delta n=1 Tax=Aliifodinibius sp. S!AR15-10 TaxID=2950437 RepID=UPI00285A66DA|nr:ATP synthase F1 subunit delta [Aliifodinibius sp. S!AR15-10]MDR8391124.1 ATP synthase F1 subunit delta [Aliifodinibius sp. S!AR15-10]